MRISTTRGLLGARLRARFSLMSLALGLAFGAVPVALSPLAVAADAPSGISFGLQGCKGSESLMPVGGPYVCPDADYTAGNLGKSWNELDLVPMRLTATATGSAPASQTYQVATVAAFQNKGVPGFDVMSVPVLNAALSSASCTAVSASPSGGAGATITPGLGSTDVSIYRLLSITQDAGTSCVYDYYQRVALGAHGYPGSSLHSELGTATVNGTTVSDLDSIPGVKAVPIDVNQTTAPSLSASLSATQGTGFSWSVDKSAQPDSLSMANTCNPDGRSGGVDITVSWTRTQGLEGQTTVVEKVYADNPAGRALTAAATATLDDASSAQVAQDSTGNVSVPANSSHDLLATFSHDFAAGASTSYSMSVAGGFTDPVTLQPVGGALTASASAPVVTVASNANATAVVTDTTTISGAHLQYSIDSVSLSGGSFGAYVLGTKTTGAVVWTSPSLSGNGSAVFHATVSATGPTAGSGSLDDTAALLGSSGFSTSRQLSVPVTTGARFDLHVDKTIPNVLQGEESASFDFTVTDAHGSSTPASIAFAAGQTSNSATLSGLAAGTYTVHEVAQSGWATQPDQKVTLGLPSLPNCSATVSFANQVVAATATVQKATVPAGSEAGWSFTLTGPGTKPGGDKVTTTGVAPIAFSTALQEGDYTITETGRNGWVQGATSGCSFTVDYPADAGHTFACHVTNVQATIGSLPTPTPTGGTQGTTTATPAGGVLGVTVTTPNTGADLPYGAGLLVLLGGSLIGFGLRRNRRTDS